MVATYDAEGSAISEDIDNIDSGDTHRFDPARSCIVSVRPGIVVLGATSVCDDVGRPAPIGFSVELWERDVDPLPPGYCHGVVPSEHYTPWKECAQDDFMGRVQIDLLPQDLEPVLPNVGDEYTETIVLSPCGNDVCKDDSPTTPLPIASRACPTPVSLWAHYSTRRCAGAGYALNSKQLQPVCGPCARQAHAKSSRK